MTHTNLMKLHKGPLPELRRSGPSAARQVLYEKIASLGPDEWLEFAPGTSRTVVSALVCGANRIAKAKSGTRRISMGSIRRGRAIVYIAYRRMEAAK